MREKHLHIETGELITRERLFAYLNNELNAAEKLDMEQRIAKDEFLSDAIDGLKNADRETVKAALDKLFRDIDILTGAKKPFTISSSVKMYAAAAILILFVGVTFIVMSRLNNNQNQTGELAYETVKKSADTIIPDSASMESDMGGGSTETDSIAGSTAGEVYQINANSVSREQIAINKQTTSSQPVQINPGDLMMDKITDNEVLAAKEDMTITTPAIAEVTITGEEEKGAVLSAPFTESNVASANESYGYTGDKDIAEKKTGDEKSKKLKNKKEVKPDEAAPATTVRSETELYDMDDAKLQADSVYLLPEIMPEFPGGQDSLLNYLKANLHYPLTDLDYEGNVFVKFVINEDGRVSDAQILKGLVPAFDIEALRVVNQMPGWIPGKQNGVPVKTYFTLVVKFSVE